MDSAYIPLSFRGITIFMKNRDHSFVVRNLATHALNVALYVKVGDTQFISLVLLLLLLLFFTFVLSLHYTLL